MICQYYNKDGEIHLVVSGDDEGNVASNLIGWHSNVFRLTRTQTFDWLNRGIVTRRTFWPVKPTTDKSPWWHRVHFLDHWRCGHVTNVAIVDKVWRWCCKNLDNIAVPPGYAMNHTLTNSSQVWWQMHTFKGKRNNCLCSAVYSTSDAQSALPLTPWQTCSSRHQLHFTHILYQCGNVYRQELIHTAEWTEALWI